MDIDQWVHPLLIRFSRALVDQGLSHLELPRRERGAYACFLELYGSRWVRQGEAWCRTLPDLVATLVLWISSGVAFAGLARCVLVLEARRGRLDLSKYHGGYDRMPMLAASFLLMGLACTGFPGTLGFVGGELLVGGAVAAFPVLGFCVVIAGALTGVAVLRMYFSLFCGAHDDAVHLRLVRREIWMVGAAAAFLVGAGLAPGEVVASRLTAAQEVLADGQALHGERNEVE